ncbi:MAG TPA: hypothetical protein ENI73_10750 [Spirochaetes bacterium]|nr:hypothetical protein [Spirochaetota bacterium]
MGDKDYQINNFAAAFIDILGQQDQLSGCGLLPDMSVSENKIKFLDKVNKTIGIIQELHKTFDILYETYMENQAGLKVPPEMKEDYERISKTELKYQRFSDGLVLFLSLGEDSESLPVNGLFALIGVCGSLAFMGLTKKQPIRAGLDIAWGVELNDNELYGCVVSKAYRLESIVAQYPRVVVGDEIVNYLKQLNSQVSDDVVTQYNKSLANICLEMIAEDYDGNYIVDYLGSAFTDFIAKELDESAYKDAFDFVLEQEKLWKDEKHTKLVTRYHILRKYFEDKLAL